MAPALQLEPPKRGPSPQGSDLRFPIGLTRGALHLLATLLLTACATVDRVDQTEFQPVGENEFVFLARASIGHPPGADTAAESERLEWIGSDLVRNGICPHGWVLVERTPLRRGREPLLGYPVNEILYHGRCAAAPVRVVAPVGEAPAQ
jgi:hypothetical protein